MAHPAEPVEIRGFPGIPGESWEDYAHRLERRVKEQRDHIDHLVSMRPPGEANKWQRKRIEQLLMALGRASEAADRRKMQRDNVIAASKEREKRGFEIETALVNWVYATECECDFKQNEKGNLEQWTCSRCEAVRVLGYDPRFP